MKFSYRNRKCQLLTRPLKLARSRSPQFIIPSGICGGKAKYFQWPICIRDWLNDNLTTDFVRSFAKICLFAFCRASVRDWASRRSSPVKDLHFRMATSWQHLTSMVTSKYINFTNMVYDLWIFVLWCSLNTNRTQLAKTRKSLKLWMVSWLNSSSTRRCNLQLQ